MPYLQGYSLEDASGTPIGDASAVALGEPNLSFNDWLNQLREILLGLVVSVDLPETRAGYALYQLVNELTGKTPPGTDLGTYIADIYSFTQPLLDSPTNLNYLMRELDNILAIDIGQVLDAISGVQGAGGKTIKDVYDIVFTSDPAGVWNYHWLGQAYEMGELVTNAGLMARALSEFSSLPYKFLPIVSAQGAFYNSHSNDLPTDIPYLDTRDILPTETLLEWAQRLDGTHTWLEDNTTGTVYCAAGSGGSTFYWVINISPAEFERLKAASGVATNVAPVWPGIDGVTLGTPVAITGVHDIIAPMDGVIITITTPPTRLGQRLLGTEPYDYGIGELAFDDGDGNVEMWQYMGFRTMILTPKSMATAGGCHLRLLGGAEGTLTPWTIGA